MVDTSETIEFDLGQDLIENIFESSTPWLESVVLFDKFGFGHKRVKLASTSSYIF